MPRLLLAMLFVMLPWPSAAGEVEWPVIETGRAGFYWSFSLRTNPEPVPPGGVSGQTVHVFVIFQEFSKTAARIIEIERRPVLLTLDKDDVATLTLLPLHARPAVLKLKRNGDESLTVSGPPK